MNLYIGDYSDMSEDEKEEIYDNCIGLPTKYYIDEYSMIEEFIENIEDVRLYNQLQIAINGRGAFRKFKDICINFDIIENCISLEMKSIKK